MTGHEFAGPMKRLIDRYKKTHPNAYPKDVQREFWNELHKISGREWSTITGKLISYNSYPPMLDKIMGFVNPILERMYREEKHRRKKDAEKSMGYILSREEKEAEKNKTGRQMRDFIKTMGNW